MRQRNDVVKVTKAKVTKATEEGVMPPIAIPPLVIWALGAVGAAALAKFVQHEWQRVNAELHPRKTARPSDRFDRDGLPTLKRDPRTGIYRLD